MLAVFQSLLSWITLTDNPTTEQGLASLLFQSLLSWITLTDKKIASCKL